MLPVRCFTCNKVLEKEYHNIKELSSSMSQKEAMDARKVSRYCCRTMILTCVDMSYQTAFIDHKNMNLDGGDTTILFKEEEPEDS